MARFYAWAQYRGFVSTNPAEALPKVRMEAGVAKPAPDLAYHEALMRADEQALGHASPATTRRYIPQNSERMRAAVNEIAV